MYIMNIVSAGDLLLPAYFIIPYFLSIEQKLTKSLLESIVWVINPPSTNLNIYV